MGDLQFLVPTIQIQPLLRDRQHTESLESHHYGRAVTSTETGLVGRRYHLQPAQLHRDSRRHVIRS